ncbi:MAG: tRNA threonylcarbamoyladenosine dehydratase [Clostridia bacterium]|nr:tRNA threonylcarbamoyladenosine dehydratase [Clostridia bacterium]
MDLSRSEILLGKQGIEKLKNGHVLIFGVGGVGSYAAEAIARSGVGEITLVDFDTVSPSNINRQIPALQSTVGKKKAEVMRDRIMDINPACKVSFIDAFCTPDNVERLIPMECSYVIDAVDTVSAKLAIIETCAERNIPVISCMGAGNKLDPTRFEVSDIFKTSVCPLCRVMRRELKKRGIEKVDVVYSREEAVKTEDGVIGSLPFVPSVAGLILAGHVIKNITK